MATVAAITVVGTSAPALGSTGQRAASVRSAASPPAAGGQLGDASRFATWTGYEVGKNPSGVAVADFNGDGRPDVAYAHRAFLDNTIAVQTNIGGGTVGDVTSYPAADQTVKIASADLNADGHPDLVAISQGLSMAGNVIDVYLNNGDGTFAHSTTTGGNAPSALAIADFNGDGHLDLALANSSVNDQGSTVSVLLGTGTGTFGAETTYTVGTGVFGLAAADFNGDGLVDLAVGQATGAEDAYHVVVLDNTGGAFAVTSDVSVPGITERWPGEPVVAAADLNGDGQVDLVAGAQGDNQVAVLLNQGGGAFSQTLLPASFGPAALIAADLDGDGHPDIAEAAPYGGTQSTGELAFLHGAGDGTFASASFINQSAQPNDVAAGDFNGDGRLDLAVPNESAGIGSIDRQLPGGGFAGAPVYTAAPGLLPLDSASADFNGDGKIDIAVDEIDITSQGFDRVAVMDNLGGGHMALAQTLATGTDSNAKDVIAADLNRDGRPDLAWTPEQFGSSLYTVAVALNRGDGVFGAPTMYSIQSCGTGHVSAIDVNGDGALDLVVANNRGGPSSFCDSVSRQLRIMINNGHGNFQADYGVQLGSLNDMAVGADFNNDRITDLFVTGAISYLVLGKRNGTFGAATSFSTRGNEAAVADLNGDGRPDIATTDGSFQNMYVMLNRGGGQFATTVYPGEKISGYLTGNAIAIGDLNADGHPDIVVSDAQGEDAGVFYGLAHGAFRSEIHYGVQADFTDVNVADYNGDGHPDIGGPAGIGGFNGSGIGTTGVTTLVNGT